MEFAVSGAIRALVIDEQESDAINAHDKLLESLGCDVTMCQYRSESVVEAQRASPHLILLDIAPGKNGFELARDLRNAEVPAFYLVGLFRYENEALLDSCSTSGFNKYVLTPACSDQLRELVNSARKLADFRGLTMMAP